ncbi:MULTISPECIES: sigma-70 family RNA polymerase sigma factor [unclassified Colwellia]|jgi:RNA polymerase sigma-70 factor (ECF subfamily)|uniref:sigma-70 family RNA polymerase sigma factor n=1 Tax=unclassified Colwellia TaxID=196834 RepID=UPI000D343787|nr:MULTISPECIES: sigma-70 family RNA polymerase sigma factor [unclassified Colwellia]AWB56406.1 RNA polymerase subunit sigma [Colwellia sp. Arc7-D]MBA6415740.1 sigma-70 family RNA polymerase sigma factor [Colwellia sp. 6M3]|tara:strand:- start:712 stop:1338 length:627 start_codon:yes stop_codon:yes gene_type:complete
MQLLHSELPSHKANATSSLMTNKIDHPQLCQWLKSIADDRDKQAFTEVFSFFAPKIKRIAQGKINSEALAAEVVQDTMTNVWRKAHLFDESKGAATTWVYTIMRNVTFDLLRKMKANKEDNLSDDIWPLAESENTEEEVFSDHIQSRNLKGIIDTLPENQQQVVKGFYFLEMSQEQLAVHLNLPLGTIKSRLRLALGKLKLKLGEDHD